MQQSHHRSGPEIKTDCPKCQGKMKLYINTQKRLFLCFKCHYKGRATKELFDFIEDTPTQPKEISAIPEKCISVLSSPTAKKYLDNRNIVPRSDWLFCVAGPYADRIIFPVYCFGKYWGFQARSVYSADIESRRYITSPGLPTSKVLYNYDIVPEVPDTPVYLCEGVFGTTVFKNGIASFTKRLSPDQATAIASKWNKIVIAYDKDAAKEAAITGYTLYSVGVEVQIMQMKHKGPDDHTSAELEELPLVPLFNISNTFLRGCTNA